MALKEIKNKVEEGDMVSKRILEGVRIELLKKFKQW